MGGIAAFASSWDSQRWRTVGIVSAVYVVSSAVALVSNISEQWSWLDYLTFMSAYKPQTMVALHEEAWALVGRGGDARAVGLGALQLVLLGFGTVFYVVGGVAFNRREIPAPV
jgi:hypothetical protein